MLDRVRKHRILRAGRTRLRITAAATLVGAVILVPAGLLGYAAVAGSQASAVRSTSLTQTQSLVGLLEDATLPSNYQGALPFEVSAEDGRVVATSGDLAEFQTHGTIAPGSWNPMTASDVAFVFRETKLTFPTEGTSTNPLSGQTLPAIDAYTPVSPLEAKALSLPEGTIVRVIVVMTPADRTGLLQDTQTLITVAVPSALAVLAVAVWFSVGSALRPITRMSTRASTLTAAHLAEGIPVPQTGDEVQELAVTLNALLGRLARADASQRAFIDDAAHELRSPITSLLTTLEVADRYPAAVDWPDALAAAIRQARRLRLLSDDLLLLTTLETDLGSPLDPIDFGRLVSDVLDQVASTHALISDISAPVIVRGRERDLGRLVQNLLDNADRHAATRIHVTLRPGDEGGTVRLSIFNDGPPIPVGLEERIFDRLVRLDTARDSATGGTGLGLAIARQIAHNHHARLITVVRENGAEFRLDIPASAHPTIAELPTHAIEIG